MKKGKKSQMFPWIWIAWGLLQTVILPGCMGTPNQAENVFSQAPENAAAGNGGAANIPLRISRDFFEGGAPVNGTLDARLSDGSFGESYPSRVDFALGDPIGPAPQTGAVADFRDRNGCAQLSGAAPSSLCFRVQGDVSSLTLTPERMWPEGLKEFLADRAPCSGQVGDPRFIRASRSATHIEALYEVSGVAGTACEGKTIQVTYSFDRQS